MRDIHLHWCSVSQTSLRSIYIEELGTGNIVPLIHIYSHQKHQGPLAAEISQILVGPHRMRTGGTYELACNSRARLWTAFMYITLLTNLPSSLERNLDSIAALGTGYTAHMCGCSG